MRFENLIARDVVASQYVARYAQKPLFHTAAWVIARTGDSIFWLLLTAVLLWLKQSIGWTLLITIAVTALLTALAKGIFKRERPMEKWAIATDIYSFPSGHAARAGAVAIALAFAFPPYAILFLLWSVLVALSRVLLSRHYLIDVVGGLIFGIFISLLLQVLLRNYL